MKLLPCVWMDNPEAASRVFIVWYKHGQEPIRLHELSQVFKNNTYRFICGFFLTRQKIRTEDLLPETPTTAWNSADSAAIVTVIPNADNSTDNMGQSWSVADDDNEDENRNHGNRRIRCVLRKLKTVLQGVFNRFNFLEYCAKMHKWHDQEEWVGCRQCCFWDIGKNSVQIPLFYLVFSIVKSCITL